VGSLIAQIRRNEDGLRSERNEQAFSRETSWAAEFISADFGWSRRQRLQNDPDEITKKESQCMGST
jgi:hypothetical protein